jgi:carboxylesterase
MDNPDEDPQHPPDPETNEFFLPGNGLSALLIHGLTGTPFEMRYLGERLAAADVRVMGVKLAGHSAPPEALGATTHANWYESAVAGFERLRAYGDPIIVAGLSMGALIATRLALDQPEAVSALALLSPAFYLPRRVRIALRALKTVTPLARYVYLYKDGGSDLHDATARRVHRGTRLMPLAALLSLVELSDYLRPRLREVSQPTLIAHSRRDHTCPYDENVNLLMRRLGTAHKQLVTLEESFHVITVDSERERVADAVVDFAGEFRFAAMRRAAQG